MSWTDPTIIGSLVGVAGAIVAAVIALIPHFIGKKSDGPAQSAASQTNSGPGNKMNIQVSGGSIYVVAGDQVFGDLDYHYYINVGVSTTQLDAWLKMKLGPMLKALRNNYEAHLQSKDHHITNLEKQLTIKDQQLTLALGERQPLAQAAEHAVQTVQDLERKEAVAPDPLRQEALTLFKEGRFEEAKVVYDRLLAQELQRRKAVAQDFANRAGLLEAQFDWRAAADDYAQAWRDDTSRTEWLLSAMKLYQETACYSSVLTLSEAAEPILSKLGAEHPDYAHLLMNIGNAYNSQGEYEKAIDAYLKAQSGYLTLGAAHFNYAQLMMNIGNVYNSQGEYEKAIDAYREANPGLLILGTGHPDYASLLVNTGVVHYKQGYIEQALEAYCKAEPGLLRLGAEHPSYARLMMNTGIAHAEHGQYERALEAYLKAEPGFRKLGTDHPDYAGLILNTGIVYNRQGQYEQALEAYCKAKSGLLRLGTEHPSYARLMMNIGTLYGSRKNYAEARRYFALAEPGLSRLGSTHPDYQIFLANKKELEQAEKQD